LSPSASCGRKSIGRSSCARHRRSTEAEIRDILEQMVRPETHPRIGSELAAFGRRFRGLDLDLTRDRTPADPAKFE
jgi:plasmid stability protein